MPATALAPFMYQLQDTLRTVELKHWVSQLDIKGVSVVVLVVLGVLLLLNLLTKSTAPYGRSVLSSAVHIWDNRNHLGLTRAFFGNRSLEPLTHVLDALAAAAKKWEEPKDSTFRKRAH
nr:uncharacterized protein LOC128689781 [Cherax quadricarinatus]